jgi:YbbR domain-containing protein
MVEIRPVIETSYRQQFNIAGPVKVMPDKVQVKGIREMIDTINFVLTEKKTFSSLDKTVKGNLRLIIPPRTELEPVRITIEIPVEEFTEKEMMVPVVMINNPGSQEIKLFPSMVRLTFLTSLTQFKLISPENFKVVADFNDIKPGITLLPVRVEKKPDLIQSFKYSPESVEFLIERK